MKKKIDFVSKVIGLVIVCSGIVPAIGLVYLIVFLGPDSSQLQQLNSSNPFGSRELNNTLYAMFQIERQFYVKLLVLSLLPIPFGMYLMNSNNFLVKYCCQEKKNNGNEESIDPHLTEFGYDDDIKIGEFHEENYIDYGKCPICNADLTKRKLEHGAHAGKYIISCSNFPGCKQIVPYKARQADSEKPFKL